jgi:energy-coupling factor transporter ATP-binding protein EcfA2
MNDSAYEQLVDRLDGPNGPTPTTVDVVLAAAEGAEALDAHLAGGTTPAARGPAARGPASATGPAEPARVYLEEIRVQSFRGIGPAARLQLQQGPGLTLVVGRNGSGKSSFAEGLELLLTGTNLRWVDRTKVWRDGWRNLHDDGSTVLAARFRLDGDPTPLEVRRRWPAGAALDAGDSIEVSGPRSSWAELGWDAPLEQYRPLLSYNELGTMFSERASALYEALSAVLGLQDFDALAATLREARLVREKSAKTERSERAQLQAALARSEDSRAPGIAALLGMRSPDMAASEALVAGDDAGSSAVRG